jgi:hypothetical protein
MERPVTCEDMVELLGSLRLAFRYIKWLYERKAIVTDEFNQLYLDFYYAVGSLLEAILDISPVRAIDRVEYPANVKAMRALPIPELCRRACLYQQRKVAENKDIWIALTVVHQFAHESQNLVNKLEAEEVAQAALFLSSPMASAITGSILFVDNGLHIMGMAMDSNSLSPTSAQG